MNPAFPPWPEANGVKACVIAPDGQSITCLLCGTTSTCLADIDARYCAACRVVHSRVMAFRFWGDGEATDICSACFKPLDHDEVPLLLFNMTSNPSAPWVGRLHWRCALILIRTGKLEAPKGLARGFSA